jgi:hypothetical protein
MNRLVKTIFIEKKKRKPREIRFVDECRYLLLTYAILSPVSSPAIFPAMTETGQQKLQCSSVIALPLNPSMRQARYLFPISNENCRAVYGDGPAPAFLACQWAVPTTIFSDFILLISVIFPNLCCLLLPAALIKMWEIFLRGQSIVAMQTL